MRRTSALAGGLNAQPREIIFTGGGSEAINLALKGVAFRAGKAGQPTHNERGRAPRGVHSLRHLEKFGFEVVVLPVDRYGRLDPGALDQAINDRTVLVS